jgi:lysophospholipase L1-like esterase
MDHMPATGVSGLDLYVRENGKWNWLAVGRPTQFPTNEVTLVQGLPEGLHEYLLYFPLYNGVESVQVGIPRGAMMAKAPQRAGRNQMICFYGTSITQGGCASRPGMAYPAILGRMLDQPTINLGFSGNGLMDLEMAKFLAELDPAIYVIDSLPNMEAAMVTERTETFVKILRRSHPETPIVLVENVTCQTEFVSARRDSYTAKNAALRESYKKLTDGGVKGLHYLGGDDLLGHDGEATVDGTHPTDLGFLRMAEAMYPVLSRLLE